MTMLELDGVRLAVHDPGCGDPTLVWGHGLTSSTAHEDESALFDLGALAGHGVRLVRYDAPGHGRSGGRLDDDAYRWDRLAGTMLGLVDALGLERAVVGGASMGCATALHLALAAPSRVEGLVLAVPPTAWASRPGQAALYRAGAELVEKQGPAGLAAVIRTSVPPAALGERGEELLACSARHIEAMDGSVLPHVLRGAAGSDLPPPADLAVIEAPALVLAWEGDPGHPVSSARGVAEALPRAELVVADSLDAVAGWPERIARFLDRIERRRGPMA